MFVNICRIFVVAVENDIGKPEMPKAADMADANFVGYQFVTRYHSLIWCKYSTLVKYNFHVVIINKCCEMPVYLYLAKCLSIIMLFIYQKCIDL